jgi:SAM-dependent methyltransferase
MVILDTLDKEVIDKIKKFIDKYDKNKNELELSLFQKTDLLTLERFNNLNSVLNIITSKNDKYKFSNSTQLDIILSCKTKENVLEKDKKENVLENYRITIDNIDTINDYIKMFSKKRNELIFSTLLKLAIGKKNNDNLKVIKKVKDVNNYITILNYYIKIKLDEELELTKEEKSKLSNVNKNFEKGEYNIVYRFKSRNSYFITKNKNVFRFDLTSVKQANNINNIEDAISKNEVELECLLSDKKVAMEEMFSLSENIIKIVQQTNNIMSVEENTEIIDLYKNLLGSNETITKLLGRQPVSLDLEQTVDNLPNNYAVTDKSDGERYMLIVKDKRCYLISNNLNVKDTGIDINSKFNNSILDGEYIFIQEYNKYLYMVFDCLVLSGVDYRNEARLMKRLSVIDELINDINKVNVKFKEIKTDDIDNMDKILDIHKNNLYLMYDDIMYNLKKSKKNVIVRKKYFVDVYGLKDNEIFYYSDLLWNTFTKDKDMNCPYELDGLIYQPLEQKYEINPKKSKLSDLKWKPANMNSIDFYIEFEKDPKTNKILVVFDDTIKTYNEDDEVEESDEKNDERSYYYICNLYAGNKIGGQEKPELFSMNKKESRCYLLINEDGNVRSIDGKIINDKTVVEFYYDRITELNDYMRWTPMRTRFDKTENVKKYKTNYGNSLSVAHKIWKTILNPITDNDFMELKDNSKYDKYIKEMRSKIDEGPKSFVKDEEYYKDKGRYEPFNQFQNWVKSQIIYTYINYLYNYEMQYKVIDFGSGRGGDIQKFYYATVKDYVGIEPVKKSIYGYKNALSRYKKFKKQYANFPPMSFIQGDATCLLTYEDQLRSPEIQRMDEEQIKLFNKFFGENNKTYFDRANSSMSLHYYLKNENSWSNFCQNLNDYLRPGGYLIFEVMDGDKIRKLLQNNNEYILNNTDENGNKKMLFGLKKKYDDNNKTHLGDTIDVHLNWIYDDDQFVSEYIVDYDFIIKSFKDKCNMRLIESDNFKTIYDNSKNYIKDVVNNETNGNKLGNMKFTSNVYSFYTDESDLNMIYKDIAFLYRYYVFKKDEGNLKEVKDKYFGKKSTIYTRK